MSVAGEYVSVSAYMLALGVVSESALDGISTIASSAMRPKHEQNRATAESYDRRANTASSGSESGLDTEQR